MSTPAKPRDETEPPAPGSPEAMAVKVREAGRLASQELAHDFTGALLISEFRPKYEVPGLFADGMRRWNFLGWLLKHGFLIVGYVVLQAITLVIFQDAGSRSPTKGKVVGSHKSSAVLFAKAARRVTRNVFLPDLFLVFSTDRVALVTVSKLDKPSNTNKIPQVKLRWDAVGTAAPTVDGYFGLVSWPDNSSVRISSY